MLKISEIVRLVQVCREAAQTHGRVPLCPLELDLTWKQVSLDSLHIERWTRLKVLDVSGHYISRDSAAALASLKLFDVRSAGYSLPLCCLEPAVDPMWIGSTRAEEAGFLEIARVQCLPWYTVTWTWRDPCRKRSSGFSPTFGFAGCQWRMEASKERGMFWVSVHARDTPRGSVSFSFQLLALSGGGARIGDQYSGTKSFRGPGRVVHHLVRGLWTLRVPLPCKLVELKLCPNFN
jgi:hypothetical protein